MPHWTQTDGIKINSKTFAPLPSVTNLVKYLRAGAARVRWNTRSQAIEWVANPPVISGETPRPFEDHETVALIEYVDTEVDTVYGVQAMQLALDRVAHERPYDPVVEYLDGLPAWDEVPRIDNWLVDVYACEAEEITKVFGRKWLISAVARAMRPGCKADAMIVVEGPQGRFKSTALEELFGVEFYSDNLPKGLDKDAELHCLGKWLVELSELSSIKGQEKEHTKAFLSRKETSVRPPYGRAERVVKRACVFAGTTNSDQYLNDETGNRRYWPVRTSDNKADLAYVREHRDQIWAEALHRYRAGETWWLTAEEEEEAERVRQNRYVWDIWTEKVEEYVNGRDMLTSYQIMQEALDCTGKIERRDQHRIAAIMRALGWESKVVRLDGRVARRWVRRQPTG